MNSLGGYDSEAFSALQVVDVGAVGVGVDVEDSEAGFPAFAWENEAPLPQAAKARTRLPAAASLNNWTFIISELMYVSLKSG